MSLTDAERADIHACLASWFGEDQQAFLVSHLAPTIERIVGTRVAEFQYNAVEMARKADIAERRAEEAEFHVEQLRDARDRAERKIERDERLIDSLGAEGGCIHGDCVLLPTRPPTYRCGECGATFDHRPALDEESRPCGEHQWLDRPESDTRECLVCGTERV